MKIQNVCALFLLCKSVFAFSDDLKLQKESHPPIPQDLKDVPFEKDNPYSKEKEDLGRKIFFDMRLSSKGNRSCSFCHNFGLAWTDGFKTSLGTEGHPGFRITQTLFNLAWKQAYASDGKFPTLSAQAEAAFKLPHVMDTPIEFVLKKLRKDIPGYLPLFQKSFASKENAETLITMKTVGMALDVFERTILSGISPFDRWVAGDEKAISEQAKKGFEIFHGKGNCALCHSGMIFSDGSSHDIGVVESLRPTKKPDDGDGSYGFVVAPLREIAQKTFFMHNGSLKSLDAVVEFYDKGGAVKRPTLSKRIKKLGLTVEEKKQLVEFLKTLVSERKQVSVPTLP